MELTSGSRLGPYEIGARLGAGGMGEVYRGRDTRLDRSVAIKVLPPKLASNAQLRARFEREAKAISQLTHPHICTLYDVGDGYLVMELLEGETLADRLGRGPLPISDVLRYGAQIADALDRAHHAGIVHRDLKPGNIMLTKSGAKLLDFGLAKSSAISLNADATTVEQQPLTEEGTILGTFQYMAPEQLEGLEADARTDIFALGAVLYEMATGTRAFSGKTKTSLIAAIVGSEPKPLSEVQPLTPPILEHVIRKCLEKDPEERWQSARDVAAELRWIADRAAVKEPEAKRRRAMLPWIAAALALVAAAVATAMALQRRAPRVTQSAFSIIPPAGTFSTSPQLSPDGTAVVFGGAPKLGEPNALWVRPIGALAPRQISGTQNATQPFWSPDGRSIAFFADGKLKIVDVEGGSPREVCDGEYGVGGVWTDDGTLVFTPAWGNGLFRVPAAGGKPEPLTKLDLKRREAVHAWPVLIRKSNTILFLNRTTPSEPSRVCAIPTDGGPMRVLFEADAMGGYSEPDVLFVRGGVLYAQQIDAESLVLEGTPRRVADEVNYEIDWVSSGASAGGETLVYYQRRHQPAVVEWVDRDGKRETIFEDASLGLAALSPDGRAIAYTRDDEKSGAQDLWLYDLRRSLRTRLTDTPCAEQTPSWSPDGRRIAFRSDANGLYEVFVMHAGGATPPESVASGPRDRFNVGWTPDGKSLLVGVDSYTQNDFWLYDVQTRKGKVLLTTLASENQGGFSPDGKWLAYGATRSGDSQVFLRNLATGESVQLSTAGGNVPKWNRNGTELYYATRDRRIMAVKLRFEGDSVEPATPVQVVAATPDAISYDVNADGTRFLVVRTVGEQRQALNVLVGWR